MLFTHNLKTAILTATLGFVSICSVNAQWSKISAIPTQKIVALTTFGDTLIAASGTNKLYISSDQGITWDSITVSNNPIIIITLKVIDNRIYVGTFNSGLFSSADNGHTWQNAGGSLAVSGIDKKGAQLYFATLGQGVYQYNENTNNWLPFNDSLPTYSVNVFSMLATTTSLLTSAGANGTMYRYNFNVPGWNEEYFDGILHAGLQIQQLFQDSDILFAVNGNRIMRSENDGLTWTLDQDGTQNGYSRTLCRGTKAHFTLTNIFGGGTWLQQRNRLALIGDSWSINETFLPDGYAYDMLELNHKFFLAKADGLYVNELLAGTKRPMASETGLDIFPNPSSGSEIKISCTSRVNRVTILDALGQKVFSSVADSRTFTIHPDLSSGVYFINLNLLNGQDMVKKLIVR